MEQNADARIRVLISLCGTSPAVVLETVFALARSGDPPRKAVFITPLAGETCLRTKLFESGVWSQLRKSLNCDISLFSQPGTSASAGTPDFVDTLFPNASNRDTRSFLSDFRYPHSIESRLDGIGRGCAYRGLCNVLRR